MLGERVACATASPHLSYIRTYMCRQLHFDFGDLNNGVCHIMKIAIAESNPDMGLLAHQTFSCSFDVLARAAKMPITTMSVA